VMCDDVMLLFHPVCDGPCPRRLALVGNRAQPSGVRERDW